MSNEPKHLPRRAPADAVAHPAVPEAGERRDGRLERRRRNRDAVLDAYLSLTADGVAEPTMEQLASIAGVSHRSVFRYFEDRRAMLHAVAGRLMEQVGPTLFIAPAPELPFDQRVRRFVRARVAVFHEIGDTAARVFSRCDDTVPGSVTDYREQMRSHLRSHFEAELDRLDVDPNLQLLDVVAAPFHFESMRVLAEPLGDPTETLSHVLTAHLHLLLGRTA